MTKINKISYTKDIEGDNVNEPLTLGTEDFKEVIDSKMYYVDKSLLIKDLLKYRGKANLITRPRRFGKSLNMSMLKYFFDINEKDNAYLFNGLKINEWEEMKQYQNKYPVIFLSLKDFDFSNYENAFKNMQQLMAIEFGRHYYLLETIELDNEREMFIRLMNRKSDLIDLHYSIKFLSDLLERYHHQKTIILIDEYDVPLNKSYTNGYYDKMVKLIRGMFSSSMKSNTSLEFCLLTGCLRISKESLFTGMNNFKVFDVTKSQLSEYFGFTHEEVVDMLNNDLLGSKLEDVEKWYNGYQFGDTRIYNPWSIISAVDEFRSNNITELCAYWGNTSSVTLIEELIEKSGFKIKQELEMLLKGESIEIELNTMMTYEDIYTIKPNDSNYFWSFMLISGYLTIDKQTQEHTTVRIPNNEVRSVLLKKIKTIIDNNMAYVQDLKIIEAILANDTDYIVSTINEILSNSMSYFDLTENGYHTFLVGLLIGCQNRYTIDSNKESGNGRYDIYLKGNTSDIPIIIEIKKCANENELFTLPDEAVKQIKDKKYYQTVNKKTHSEVILIGIAFHQKECKLKIEKMSLKQ